MYKRKIKKKISDYDGSGGKNVSEEKGLQIDRKANKNQDCLKLWPGHTKPRREI